MKNYIKPTFTLAGLFPVAFAAGCPVKVTGDDLTVILETFGVTDASKAFTESEGCEQAIPDGVTQYCKYTSTGEETAGTVFTS